MLRNPKVWILLVSLIWHTSRSVPRGYVMKSQQRIKDCPPAARPKMNLTSVILLLLILCLFAAQNDIA